MGDNIEPEKDSLYRVKRNADDLMRNLHQLYDSVSQERVPDDLLDLLKKLPK